jgi:hypothetical protein
MNSQALRVLIAANFEVVEQRSTADELCFVCPTCGDKSGHRSVNLKTGLTNCFRCERGGDHIEHWLRKRGIEVDQGLFRSATAGLEELRARLEGKGKRGPSKEAVELPSGFTRLEDDWSPIPGLDHSVYYRLIARMARRKNLRVDDLIEAGAGYTRDGFWQDYCIFPVINYGRLVYFQGRAYSEDTVPGKRFPSRQEVSSGMSECVYNLDAIADLTPTIVVVVESILNVLSLRRHFKELGLGEDIVPVSTFHAGITKAQVSHLLHFVRTRKVGEIIVLLDHDATAKAIRVAHRLGKHYLRCAVTVAEMPATCGPKTDPNDDVEAAFGALGVAKRVSVVDRLFRQMTQVQ